MRSHKTVTVLALCALSASCSTLKRCGPKRKTSPSSMEVAWPASAPKKASSAKPHAAPSQPNANEVISVDRPGVKAREGHAHDLSFLEVVLGDAEFDDPLPLVILLHGRGDRPRVPGGPFGGIPTAMRVILPRAPTPLGEGFTWLPVSITSGKIDVLAKALARRAQHLAALIDWVKNNRPTLGRPIVSGFSQGGMLSFVLAILRPDIVEAALPMAGWVPPSLMPTAAPVGPYSVRIRAAHGGVDPVVPVDPTRKVVQALKDLGWDADLQVFDGVAHVVDHRMNAAFESWLEEAVGAQAPALAGGLGLEGPEADVYEDVEPLEEATIDAIVEEEEAILSGEVDAALDAEIGDEVDEEANQPEESTPNTPSTPKTAPEPATDPPAPGRELLP